MHHNAPDDDARRALTNRLTGVRQMAQSRWRVAPRIAAVVLVVGAAAAAVATGVAQSSPEKWWT